MLRVAVFGAIALIGLALVAIAVFYWSFTSTMSGQVRELETAAQDPATIVTEDKIAALPAAAQLYLRHAGVVGTPIPRLVRLTQKGRIRNSADAQWMTFEAEETYSTSPPAFVWRAWFPTQGTPLVLGRDVYLNGEGSILMKMLGVLPIADEHGEELRAAGLMRYLNEMAWFPAAYLGDNVEIIERDALSFTVRLRDRGLTAEGIVFMDEDGRMTNFQAQRFNTASRTMQTWETPITGDAQYGAYVLPKAGSAVWRSSEGDLTYIELEIIEVRYEP